jgi:putative ABC transport system ATP-binding protein
VLRELNHDGQTLVLVTHDRSLAQRFAARTVQLVDGQLVSSAAGVPA